MPEKFIGLMSGTSMDAIDAALVDFSESQPRLIHACSEPLNAELRQEILALCQSGDNEIERMGQLDMKLGRLFARSVQLLLSQARTDAGAIRAIGSHGQTIRHKPSGPAPFSLQIGNAAMIARLTGITTVADFRNNDIVAGGQGAPLVPAFHQAVFTDPDHHRCIVNIGGMANITILPAAGGEVSGFDTGPGNALIDYCSQSRLDLPVDSGGATAARGQICTPLLEAMLADSYFSQAPPKSTGREHFNEAWLEAMLGRVPGAATLSDPDLLATITALTARSIALHIRKHAAATAEIYVCGGGVHNTTLMTMLATELALPVQKTDELGVAADWVEAMAFAWLAKQTLEGKSGNLPAVTGAAQAVVLGGIYRS